MGISRGFHSGVHVLDACLVGAVRQARAGRKKKKKKTRETRKGVLWTSKGKDAALFKREERTLSVCFKMFSLG